MIGRDREALVLVASASRRGIFVLHGAIEIFSKELWELGQHDDDDDVIGC